MPLPEPLDIGDRLTVFASTADKLGFGGLLGVDSQGRCYPLSGQGALAVGTELVVDSLLGTTSHPEVTASPEGQDVTVDVRPPLTYKYGWAARTCGGRNLVSSSEGVRPLSSESLGEDVYFCTADLRPGVYVRLAFSQDGSEICPVVVRMTDDGPQQHIGKAIDLTSS